MTHENVVLSSTLSACAQTVEFISMLLEEMNEVQNPSVIYKDNQGAIILAKIRQFNIRNNHIYIRYHFLRDMAEDKDNDIKYTRSEEKSADIMTKNNYEADFVKYMKIIT